MTLPLKSRFAQLDALLAHHRELWQLRPFEHLDLPSWRRWPGLTAWLRRLPTTALTARELPQEQRAALGQRLPCVTALANATQLALAPLYWPEASSRQRRFIAAGEGVGGRKWAQVQAFAQRTPFAASCVVEWCSGKGHLSRLLTLTGQRRAVGLEIDLTLCCSGERLAQRVAAPVRFAAVDVESAAALPYLGPDIQVVALHACGDLHRRLLLALQERPVAAVSLSPCCYNRTASPHHHPFSTAAAGSLLTLSREDLKLPLQETVTAPGRIATLRQRELTWRLGYDLLQRELSGKARYVSLPTVPKALIRGEFADFCRWAAQRQSLELPLQVAWGDYQRGGLERAFTVLRLELIQGLFRRPLELWLLYDMALYLAELGYRVGVGRFCQPALTPRNLLICAQRID